MMIWANLERSDYDSEKIEVSFNFRSTFGSEDARVGQCHPIAEHGWNMDGSRRWTRLPLRLEKVTLVSTRTSLGIKHIKMILLLVLLTYQLNTVGAKPWL